jgi:hypothetical protein
MCGGYSKFGSDLAWYVTNNSLVNRDDFISRYKMTNRGREEVLRDLA